MKQYKRTIEGVTEYFREARHRQKEIMFNF